MGNWCGIEGINAKKLSGEGTQRHDSRLCGLAGRMRYHDDVILAHWILFSIFMFCFGCVALANFIGPIRATREHGYSMAPLIGGGLRVGACDCSGADIRLVVAAAAS
jgi:hypothetical protein